jgi:copper chaperone CopZ
MNKILSSFLFSLLFATLVSSKSPAAANYTIQAKGLNCAFCTYTVERLVTQVPGTEKKSFSVELKQNIVSVSAKPDQFVSPVALKAAIENSGFKFESVEAELVGVFDKKDGLMFRPRNSKIQYSVIGKVPSTLNEEVLVRGRFVFGKKGSQSEAQFELLE